MTKSGNMKTGVLEEKKTANVAAGKHHGKYHVGSDQIMKSSLGIVKI